MREPMFAWVVSHMDTRVRGHDEQGVPYFTGRALLAKGVLPIFAHKLEIQWGHSNNNPLCSL